MATTKNPIRRAYTPADCRDFAHTGPSTLTGQYLRRFWQPVYLSENLAPGAAKPIRVMGEDFTLYRGETGAPHVVAHRCAHRGTQLSIGCIEGDCIRCFYHGWKYDATGQCVEQPAEIASFASKVRIASYPTREYLGLIFAYLGEGEPPSFPKYPDLETDGVLEVERITCNFNYFNEIENAPDEIHVYFAHRDVLSDSGLMDLPTIKAEETEYGFVQYGIRKQSIEMSWVTHYLMPNVLQVLVPPSPEYGNAGGWRYIIYQWVPINDETHFTYCVRLVRVPSHLQEQYRKLQRLRLEKIAELPKIADIAEDVLSGKLRIADINRPDRVWVQDHVVQAGQGVIADREHEHLGQSDVAIILLRKIWERELRALAEGRALKNWVVPSRLKHTVDASLYEKIDKIR